MTNFAHCLIAQVVGTLREEEGTSGTECECEGKNGI